jgi:DNA-binding CsgD family transcriptional regulator
VLVGREHECACIDRLLAEAREGLSGVLVLHGEPGIGKSALLAHAVEHAADLTVLGARGVESESELLFAALGDLLGPVVDRLGAIPAPQAAAVRGALALGPPVGGDRFAVAAGTLSLLAVAAVERPLLAAVDDVHWLDGPSREALLFAARRLRAEGVALLLAGRDAERWLTGPPLPAIRLGGLGEAAARALLERRAGRPVPATVAKELVEATAGNPLALVESCRLLSEAQLAGREPLPTVLPVDQGLEGAFLSELEGVPPVTRGALLVAAICESSGVAEIGRVLVSLGIPPGALEVAEERGLIAIEDDALRFRHPLLRAAVHRAGLPAERRRVHRAFADALAGDRERRAWHLAAAVTGPDDGVAAALEQAALEAQRRSGHPAAARAFERAAQLTAAAEPRARRLLQAAGEDRLAGRLDRAAALLEAARGLTDDAALRAEIDHQRAQTDMLRGAPMAAHAILVEGAARIQPQDPAKAAAMLADATLPCMMASEVRTALATAQRGYMLARRTGGLHEVRAAIFLAHALVVGGEGVRAEGLLAECPSPLGDVGALRTPWLLHAVAYVLQRLERYAEARLLLDRIIAAARSAGAPAMLPFPLATLSELDFHTGRWTTAMTNADESARLAIETGQDNILEYGLICRAYVEAGQGRERECRAHVAQALALARRFGSRSMLMYGGSVLGLLALGHGRNEEAVAHLEPVARQADQDGVREPGVAPWAGELVEAYVRAGRLPRAREALAELERRATHTRRRSALGAACRCRGLLAGDDGFEQHFADAVDWHDPNPFERARTELCWGERLRRTGQRVQARQRLRSALQVFEDVGADPWAERTRGELRCSGERLQRPAERRRLTPQELQVALTVAGGATNREAAAALFLSPKTIEFHLGHVYRKLGIRSRADLARLGAEPDALAANGAEHTPADR